jgi:hypothetical protein
VTRSDQGRRDLHRVLTSPSKVSSDVIRQLHERPDGQEMVDLLIFLKEWDWARQGMIGELSRAKLALTACSWLAGGAIPPGPSPPSQWSGGSG